MRTLERWKRWAVRAFVWGVVLGGGMLVMTAGTVTYTSRSEFCNSCHIMEPYYESWRTSAHSHVDCVDCHFEPGILETAEGKFKAVNQLAKYVTRTAGTKPWAEVSDQSCMRSGCHSERLLSGPITFGRIRFDHRHHLLETRRGRQLRCTSCHSQIVQGQHMNVTTSTCFLCHFRDTGKSRSHGECPTCHGPPAEDLDVAGRKFRHADWTGRGVDCVLCHRNVTRGTGLARKHRCNTCHGEARHVERFDDVAFIHENHITLHKVECDQCHDVIEHGLVERDHTTSAGDCGACHDAGHDVQRLVRAGKGGAGVAGTPDRMYDTRVDCSGCHREWFPGGKRRPGTVAPATDVACMHCHGPGYGPMLRGWQEEVRGALGSLDIKLSRLEGARGSPAPASLDGVRENLDLVRDDGSFGAHNIGFVLALLRKAKDDLNAAGPQIDPGFKPLEIDIGVPRPLETTCATTCHVNAARLTGRFGGVAFRHRPHLLGAELDCNACHDEEDHGRTTVTPQDCTSCHHGKKEPACGSCHDREEALLRGRVEVEGVKLDLAHDMEKLACADCHRTPEPKDVVADVRGRCVECHENKESFGEMLDQWREALAEERSGLEKRFTEIGRRLDGLRAGAGVPAEVATLLDRARRCFDAAAHAGPAHNVNGASSLFAAAGEILDRIEEVLGR